jgi:alkylation response protein AidB-like acyl-CoA dehydrogenase
MSLALDREQEQLRTELRRFFAERSDSERVRALMESDEPGDPLVWQQMAEQLGLQGLVIPEEFGGQGFGPTELAIVCEELGRALVVSPYFATVALGVQALLAAGDSAAQERWLPQLADGSLSATLALAEEHWSLETIETRWRDGRLSGSKSFVHDGLTAQLVLVVARDDDGLALFAVEPGAEGLTRTPMPSLDPTRRLARLDLDKVPATRVGGGGGLQRAVDLAVVALSAEQVGGAQQCLDMSVDYAKTRVQFGRPIGTFQAIKHKCADVLLAVESARSASMFAAAAATEGTDDELAAAASVAKAYCSTAYTFAAKESIQIHGGIGFTWEHDAHLHLRRAKSSELLLGTPAEHRARLADLTGM